jgi:hypothetical protein
MTLLTLLLRCLLDQEAGGWIAAWHMREMTGCACCCACRVFCAPVGQIAVRMLIEVRALLGVSVAFDAICIRLWRDRWMAWLITQPGQRVARAERYRLHPAKRTCAGVAIDAACCVIRARVRRGQICGRMREGPRHELRLWLAVAARAVCIAIFELHCCGKTHAKQHERAQRSKHCRLRTQPAQHTSHRVTVASRSAAVMRGGQRSAKCLACRAAHC